MLGKLGELKNLVALLVLLVIILIVAGIVLQAIFEFAGLIIILIILYFVYRHMTERGMRAKT